MAQQRAWFAQTAAVAMLAGIAIFSAGCSTEPGDEQDYRRIDDIHYIYRLQNNLNRELESAPVTLYLPLPDSSYQKSLDTEIRGVAEDDYRLTSDAAGNSAIRLDLANLSPGFSAEIRVNAKIGHRETAVAIDEASIRDYLALPPGEQASPAGTDNTTGAGEEQPGDLKSHVQAVFKHLESVPDPDAPAKPEMAKSATDADQSPTRHPCLETAVSFTRAARARGMPARPVVGFYIDGETALTASDLRCWVEVYESSVWHPVSLENESLIDKPANYVVVRNFAQLDELRQIDTLASLLFSGFGVHIGLR